jgi:hypothetical protein
MSKKCFLWSELAEEWIGANYIWSDVCIIIKVKEALSAGGGGVYVAKSPLEKIKDYLDDTEYKRFIEIVCHINGLTFRDVKERRDSGHPEVTFIEIKKAITSVSRASVKVTRISREDI